MQGQKTHIKKADPGSFLKKISFDKRVANGSWTTKELRLIMRDVIQKYFSGKVDEDFVIYVGSAIHQDILHSDKALMNATCIINDLEFADLRKQYSNIDQAFRQALRFIKE
jgi:hypothetical protein